MSNVLEPSPTKDFEIIASKFPKLTKLSIDPEDDSEENRDEIEVEVALNWLKNLRYFKSVRELKIYGPDIFPESNSPKYVDEILFSLPNLESLKCVE